MSLDACFKKFHLINVGRWRVLVASKLALFSMSGLKDEKLIKKQTYMKTETCKLYSRVI